jgi:hypothetical protein
MARLDDGVCEPCLTDPRRGRRWAEVSNRCRKDVEFARRAFDAITSATGRRIFVQMYGNPYERGGGGA